MTKADALEPERPNQEPTTGRETDFDLLYETLKDVYNKYINNVFSTIGSVIIAIGWILNSESSRDFLQESNWAYYLSVFAVVAIWLIHIVVIAGAYKASNRITKRLKEEYRLQADYYFYYEITRTKIVGSCVLDSILFGVLLLMVLAVR